MEVITSLDGIERFSDGVVTVGTFDGIHIAHREIIERVIRYADAHQCASTVVTFDPHPRLVVGGKNAGQVKLLTTTREKIVLLREFAIDRLIIIPFTTEFSKTSPEDFLKKVLCERVGMQKLIIGYDHGFGRNRAGGIDFLREYVEQCEFKLNVQEPISNESGVVSSSQIRGFLKDGKVGKARLSLGRAYTMSGIVVSGDERGRTIGFPTANIQLADAYKAIPKNGVYAVSVTFDGELYNGIMNIGRRPTFGENERSLEVHLFGFSGDIYGSELTVGFLDRIRGEQTFDSAGELKSRIKEDIKIAQQIHMEYKSTTNQD